MGMVLTGCFQTLTAVTLKAIALLAPVCKEGIVKVSVAMDAHAGCWSTMIAVGM